MAKPSTLYTRGSTRGPSDATGPAAAASPRASRTSNAATSCPTSAVRANTSHGRRRRASVFEFWITMASLTFRSRAPARDVAAAIARDTRPTCTKYILTPARSSAIEDVFLDRLPSRSPNDDRTHLSQNIDDRGRDSPHCDAADVSHCPLAQDLFFRSGTATVAICRTVQRWLTNGPWMLSCRASATSHRQPG